MRCPPAPKQPFSLLIPGKVVFGRGSFSCCGTETRALGKRALVVTGRSSLSRLGWLRKLEILLDGEGVKSELVSGICPDPDLEAVDGIVQHARQFKPEVIVGLGGGSALDVAKAVAGIAGTDGSVKEYFRGKEIEKPGIPFLAIPSTAGTGTEATTNSVLVDRERMEKKSIRSPYLLARTAIVDPELTLSLPPELTAVTGFDALTHAVECYVSKEANAFSDGLAMQAIRLIGRNLAAAYERGRDRERRNAVALGSLLAGLAFANARLGAVHGLAHPLGVHFGLSHGVACALLLPAVMEFNHESEKEKYGEIALALGQGNSAPQAVVALREKLKLRRCLREVGVKKEDLLTIARRSLSSGSLKANPRAAGERELVEILRRSW